MELIKIVDDELTCRIADAIFFEDDSFALIEGNFEMGYKIQKHISIELLAETGWADLYPNLEDSNDRFIALAGTTSWGGTGCILLKDKINGSIKWLIHLSTMNNPEKVKIENDLVRVTTDLNYPDGVDFVVPMNNPMGFWVEKPALDQNREQ